MECPKCHKVIAENLTVCPECNKVIALRCPNCGSLGETPICQKCGYTILVKCSKCSKISPVDNINCSKCGFSLVTSLAYQECESDEFASIIVKFGALRKIRSLLKSQELYSKFLFKLKNLLYAQLNGIECKFIVYGNEYVINLNKELSLSTSANKAVRLALKIVNAFTELNNNITDELGTSLDLSLTVIKKDAEKLQDYIVHENNVKLLTVKKGIKKYLKGMQLVLDQYVWEEVKKDYKTDSLYTIESHGEQLMFYEVILDSYALPVTEKNEDVPVNINKREISKIEASKDGDIYSFKTFDISAKASFKRTNAIDLLEDLEVIDFKKGGRIISLKSDKAQLPFAISLIDYFDKLGLNVLKVSCSQQTNDRPWGFFIELFKEYFNLPVGKEFNFSKIAPNMLNLFRPLFDLILNKPTKAMTPEDARFMYMELWNKFLSLLSNTVIIIEGVDILDDTSLQTLQLYFDKFKNVKPNFIFMNNVGFSLHSKLKPLLRTDSYAEFTMTRVSMDSCLSTLKSDATDFIQSFYFEKIKENFKGSYLYFINSIEYLKETGVLIDFEDKLIIKDKKSVVVPKSFNDLLKARLKNLSKSQEISFILAYLVYFGGRVDIKTLEILGVSDCITHVKNLQKSNLIRLSDDILTLNDFIEVEPVIAHSLKKEAEIFLAKNVLTHLSKILDDTIMAKSMNKLSAVKEEYLTLWKNSQFAIKVGDYDSYLKNCLRFLSLIEQIESNIPQEEIEANKKDVYNNILMFLYAYSPEKIYYIENILLMDAIREDDNDKIVKLSNLMLQGALVTANYADASGLLHNILSRMQNPSLLVDGVLNTKFFLLTLVNIEILYNIGDFESCVESAEDVLNVLRPEMIEKVKPASFSINLFMEHLMETFRMAVFAKLQMMNDDLLDFIERIELAMGAELPEKDCILAIKDFLADKVYTVGNIEEYSPYSKVIFLILQELSSLENDYNKFAQNIYQAKLLSIDIRQKELELLCDLLLGYAYSKAGINEKADYIYNDVLLITEKSAMFSLMMLTKFLISKLLILKAKKEEALNLINDALAIIRKKNNNMAKILFALFETLYISIAKEGTLIPCDIEVEEMKLNDLREPLKRIIVNN